MAKTRDKKLAQVKSWRAKNPDKVKANNIRFRKNNPNYKKEFARKYPEKAKAQIFKSLMWRLGVKMTYKEFEIILEEQNGVCAICGKKNYNRRLSVDHCHKTGKDGYTGYTGYTGPTGYTRYTGYIRGLLCQSCNMGIGHFGDNPKLLERAIKYLTIKK